MFHSGDQLGPYVLIRELGHGAFGVVWLAERRGGLATTRFAIKLPRRSGIDITRFRQEAEAWQQANNHPNVLPIIEADIYDGQVAIVAEYAPDGSLEKWLQRHRGKAPTNYEAIKMVAGILAGLAHLHSRRRPIIHRDLKPANILLQSGTPKLADFGLAKILQSSSEYSDATGSLAYMAPEALKGKVSKKTDIWSVGVIMYQLLVGRLPFEGSTAAELIDAIRTLPPQPIPDTVPKPVAKILLRALNKNPEHRFHSATAMGHALEHVLTKPPGSPVDSMARTKTHWATYFRTRWQQNSRKYILRTLLVLAIAAVSVGLYYANLPGIYLKRARSGAQSADESISALTYVIERQPGNAEAYMLRGKAFDQKGQLDAALQDFSRYIELRMTDPNGYFLRGNILERKCDCNSAIDDYTRVLILQPQNNYAYFCRGRATVNSGNTDQGLEDVNTAIRINPKENAYYMFRGTVLLDGKGDAEAAIKDFSTVIADDSNYQGAHFYRGRAHEENDDGDSAIADYTTETQLDPANYASYYNRGLQYYARKQNDLALADLRTALQLDAGDAEARYMIGKILLENKDYNGAIEKFNDALAQWKTNAERYQAQREANADCTCNPAYEDPDARGRRIIDPEVYLSRGIAFFQTGRTGEALADLRLARLHLKDTEGVNLATTLLQNLGWR